MRSYTAPFGYKYDMGKIVIDAHDCAVVKYIFELGVQGVSLNKISSLGSDKYPDITFNKCKISRILKDVRYVGNARFDQIIEESVFDKANKIKSDTSTHKASDDKAEVLFINVPFRCPECHSSMRRYHDSRNKCPERWKCSSAECGYSINFSDIDMIDEIRTITTNLKNLKIDCKEDIVRRSIDTARLENDIKTQMSSENFDVDQLREKIIRLAAQKYSDIPDIGAKQKEIMNDIKFGEISDRYIEFINNNAIEVDIESDHSLTIVLKDGTKHRRTSTYGDSNVFEREESNMYSSDQKFG